MGEGRGRGAEGGRDGISLCCLTARTKKRALPRGNPFKWHLNDRSRSWSPFRRFPATRSTSARNVMIRAFIYCFLIDGQYRNWRFVAAIRLEHILIANRSWQFRGSSGCISNYSTIPDYFNYSAEQINLCIRTKHRKTTEYKITFFLRVPSK